MNIEQVALDQIATTLGRHFEFIYYIDIESSNYCEFISSRTDDPGISQQGDDFFAFARETASSIIHPGDLEMVLKEFDKEELLKILSQNNSYTVSCRILVEGKILHVRHIFIMCEDKKHMLFCVEDVEKAFQEKETQKRNMQSVQRAARRDELTGIKNQKAYTEESMVIDKKIRAGRWRYNFGIVVCDINNLKLINDTRGHSSGDEAIRRASCMICEVYKHSPVFRIGGDEFAVFLSGNDFERRESLLSKLKEESRLNKQSRSGPEVACGMAVYDPAVDTTYADVFKRADNLMYENKNELKAQSVVSVYREMSDIDTPIPDDRKRLLDGMFGALLTIAGDGYVYLNDMKYDYSRWSLSLIDDFGIESEYMYHADRIWTNYIHPDDLQVYKEAVEAVLCGDAELRLIYYRARKVDGTYAVLTTRGFVLSDSEGNPEYFGGIMVPQN